MHLPYDVFPDAQYGGFSLPDPLVYITATIVEDVATILVTKNPERNEPIPNLLAIGTTFCYLPLDAVHFDGEWYRVHRERELLEDFRAMRLI